MPHPDYTIAGDDALAYVEFLRLRDTFKNRLSAHPNNLLVAGEALARASNCFLCHGYLGQNGLVNPGALKGYVPGFYGQDFRSLTENGDPESVRNWIRHGVDPNLLNNPFTGPLANYFIERQKIQMPPLASIEDEKMALLVTYIRLLNALGPMTATTVKQYETLSTSEGFELRDVEAILSNNK